MTATEVTFKYWWYVSSGVFASKSRQHFEDEHWAKPRWCWGNSCCWKWLSLCVIVLRKRAHNAGTLESLFIVESDIKRSFSFKMIPRSSCFLSGDMFEGVVRSIATPSWVNAWIIEVNYWLPGTSVYWKSLIKDFLASGWGIRFPWNFVSRKPGDAPTWRRQVS